jgi:hypothetical protein
MYVHTSHAHTILTPSIRIPSIRTPSAQARHEGRTLVESDAFGERIDEQLELMTRLRVKPNLAEASKRGDASRGDASRGDASVV